MKKLFRMALVLVLAGSALLYTSCTKDYSPDIQSLQDQINVINTDPNSGLPWVRSQLEGIQGDLSALRSQLAGTSDSGLLQKINKVSDDLAGAIQTINEALAGKADQSYVDEQLGQVRQSITDLQSELEARLDAIDGENGRLALLEAAAEDLGIRLDDLDGEEGRVAVLEALAQEFAARLDAIDGEEGALALMQDAIDALGLRLDAIDGEEGALAQIAETMALLQQSIDDLAAANEAISGQFETYAKFIQSIAYVPASTDGRLVVTPYYLTNTVDADHPGEQVIGYEYSWRANAPQWLRNDYTPQEAYGYYSYFWGAYIYRQYVQRDPIYEIIQANEAGDITSSLVVATFKVTPAEAVDRVNDGSASLVAVQTKAAAAAPDTLLITKMIKREDAPGYVDVFAILGNKTFDPNSFAVALSVTQVEDDLVESVTSDYAAAYVVDPENIKFEIFDNNVGDIVDPETYDDPVRVSPTSDPDSVNVYTEGRWSVVASFEGTYLTCEEAAEVFGLTNVALTSPAVGDTIVEAVEEDEEYYAWHDYGFESTVEPAEDVSVIDLIVDNHREFTLALYLANSHMVGEDFPHSGTVYGTYMAVPDTTNYNLTPVDLYGRPVDVVIPWDYQYYDNIKDTLIAKIKVDGDRDMLVGADETVTWNTETETDYTQGTGEVTAHSNDKNAIDAELLSTAEYGEADSTYVYSIRKFNEDDATEYVGEFEYTVEARPADAVIELGPIDTMVHYSGDTEIALEAITAAYEFHADAYDPYTLDEVAADAVAGNYGATIDKVEVTVDGEPVDVDASVVFGFEDGEETTTLTLPLNLVGEWKVYIYTHFANVGYTFVVTINAENNAARIAAKDAYVTVESPEDPKYYSVEVKGDVYEDSYHYYLVDEPFQDYLKVIKYAEGSDELLIELQTITEMPDDATVVEPTTNPTGLVRLVEDKTVANLADKANYEWGTWDSLAFEVAARLIPATQEAPEGALVDSATVKLWTKNPIPVFDGGDGIYVEHEKDQLAKTNVIAGLNIQDLNGIKLNDENGLRPIGPDDEADEIVVDYDQEIEIGNVELVSGADFIEELNIYFDPEDTNVLCLDLNQGVIVDPIIVRIPIKLSHMLDRGMDNTTYVYVVFYEKGSARPEIGE